ncbi:hypothetical protein AB3X96_39215 [Paraburkholderia sp. BR13439]|uniref:hypothetical protein n=1 Tax=Paraburkholderia sp. BR13439 TaxID=3236996 RepID=UPI0034CFBCA3
MLTILWMSALSAIPSVSAISPVSAVPALSALSTVRAVPADAGLLLAAVRFVQAAMCPMQAAEFEQQFFVIAVCECTSTYSWHWLIAISSASSPTFANDVWE